MYRRFPFFMKKRSRQRSRFVALIQFALFIIILMFIIYMVALFIPRRSVNNEVLSEQKYFGSTGNEVSIIYNGDLQSAKALNEEGVVYLPLIWAQSILNDRFYYDYENDVIIYTLPDSVVSCNLDTLGNNGKPLILKRDENIFLSSDIISTYTNVDFNYIEGESKRIVINNIYGDRKVTEPKRDCELRLEADRGSYILKHLTKKDSLTVLNEKIRGDKNPTTKWKRVMTSDGYVGYVENKYTKASWNKNFKSSFEEPKYTSLQVKDKIILGWLVNYEEMKSKDIESNLNIIDMAKGMNVVSPTWYSLLDNNGNISSKANKEFVDKLHERGMLVWPLIDNFNKNVNSEILFSDTNARRKVIDRIINDSLAYNYDGINIDFEGLKQGAIKHVIQFIRELSVECRKNNIILSMDVPNYLPFNDYYLRDKLFVDVDYLINMAYDEHYSGSEKGSVASLKYVSDGIKNSLKEIPAEKLINAMPLYTRIWTDDSSKAVGIKDSIQWISDNNVDINWDEELGQYYGEAKIEGKKHYIWVEDSKSIEKKVELAKENNLAGVALWRLGMESEDIWKEIVKFKE